MYLVKHHNVTAALHTPEQVYDYVLETLIRETADMTDRDIYYAAVAAKLFAETRSPGNKFKEKHVSVEIK